MDYPGVIGSAELALAAYSNLFGARSESKVRMGASMLRASVLILLWCLVSCGPSVKDSIDEHISCLNRICDGEIIPEVGANEAVFKVNGQWFIGPNEYYANGRSRTGFEWWNHEPLARTELRPDEAQEIVLSGRGYDISIEVFLQTIDSRSESSTLFSVLLRAEGEGRLISQETLRPGLELEDETPISYDWYVATELREPYGEPPVLACRGNDPSESRCTTGFVWQPGIAVDMRFRVTHAQDWPEIYAEVIRVLQLLRNG